MRPKLRHLQDEQENLQRLCLEVGSQMPFSLSTQKDLRSVGVFLSVEHKRDSNKISLCLKLVNLIAIPSNVRFYFFIIGM